MINTAEVMLWGTRIGIIHMNEANGVVAFEYDITELIGKEETL